MDGTLAQFEGEQYLNLETFRKAGAGVKTPVWFVQEGRTFYIVTVAGSGKVKRIRNGGKVRIVPCTANGTVTGDWVDTRAEIIHDAAEENRINDLFNRKYGILKAFYAIFNKISGKKRTFIRVASEPA